MRGVAVLAVMCVATVAGRSHVDPDIAYVLFRWDALAAGCLLALTGWRPRSCAVPLIGLAAIIGYTA